MVFYDPRYIRAQSVVVLVNAPYEKVLGEFRDVVAQRIGIVAEAEVHERDEGIFPDPEPVPIGLQRRLLFEKGFVKFREIGIRMKHPKEYQLKSRRYNEVEELSGSSELRLRMADGKALFGKSCTLIVMSRIDYTRQYPRYYDIPIPPKESMEHDLVTDTEIGLVEDLAARLGSVTPCYFVPYPGGRYKGYWVDFMKEIKEAGSSSACGVKN